MYSLLRVSLYIYSFMSDQLHNMMNFKLQYGIEHTGSSFDDSAPGEEDLINYFKFIRTERKMASSSMWVQYSHVNVVLKNRYGIKLQGFPRITTLLKSYDTDVKQKASVFESDDIQQFIERIENSPYWQVRKVLNK